MLLREFQQKDSESLKLWFAENAIAQIDDLDKKIEDLFDYCEGEFLSVKGYSRPLPGYEDKIGAYSKDWYLDYVPFYSYLDFETDNGVYRVAAVDMETPPREDTHDVDPNWGIWAIYVIKAEEGEDLSVPYVGDGQFTTGIHIGVR